MANIALKRIRDIRWTTLVKNDELSILIKENIDLFQNAGGDVENFISKCKIAHANRVFILPVEIKFILTIEDFKNGMKILEKNKHNSESKKYLEMYS